MTLDATDRRVLRPHTGPQTAFLSSSADICIGGGAAGGGKTLALLMEPLRHCNVPGFSSVLFRRTSPQLTGVGGPWLESLDFYPGTGARATHLKYVWPSGAHFHLRHLQHLKDRLNYKGWQIGLLLFDQLEEFLEEQFWYLVSRNRSTSGVRPYIRATCNPVPDSDPVGGWLHSLLSWWLDEETGYPRMDRAGALRWFVRVENTIEWSDSREALRARFPKLKPLSLSFVPMSLDDNPTLRAKDPDYEAKLDALPYVERMRLRRGNWKIRAAAGTVFKREWFKVVDSVPHDAWRCRFWDCAGTDGGGNYTAGVRVSIDAQKRVFIEDVVRGQWSAASVKANILQTAQLDGYGVMIREEQEPGSSGKAVIADRLTMLHGYDYGGVPTSTAKLVKWRPFRAQAEGGNVYVLRRRWTKDFIDECEGADGLTTTDDQVDGASGGYLALTRAVGSGSIVEVPILGARSA